MGVKGATIWIIHEDRYLTAIDDHLVVHKISKQIVMVPNEMNEDASLVALHIWVWVECTLFVRNRKNPGRGSVLIYEPRWAD